MPMPKFPTDLLRIMGMSLCVFATKLTAGGFKNSHFFRLGPFPASGVSFSPGIAPWCWCSLLPMCELAPFQCSALAAWAACSLDLGVEHGQASNLEDTKLGG